LSVRLNRKQCILRQTRTALSREERGGGWIEALADRQVRQRGSNDRVDGLGKIVSWRSSSSPKEGHMHARIATFESDPAKLDEAIDMVRSEVESGDTPEGLEGAKMLMLINRETGKGLGVTLFESEEAMRRGDEALNAMNPGASERRTSVEFYEVPVQTVS
jgi:heme-degrading monooxygenase HmoA